MEVRGGVNAHYKLRDDAAMAGWYSPKVGDVKEGGEQPSRINGPWGCGGVAVQSQMAGWTTPCDCMVKGGYTGGKYIDGVPQTNRLDYAAQLAGWPTTRATDFKTGISPMDEGGGVRGDLVSVTQLSGWQTPMAGDGEVGPNTKRGVLGGRCRLAMWSGDGESETRLAGWRSPGATDAIGNETPEHVVERRGGVQRLMVQSQLAGWATPVACESGKAFGRGEGGGELEAERSRGSRGMERG